jgi:hypothetical protein
MFLSPMLHIHNGDSTAGTAIRPAFLVTTSPAQAMICGPAPGDLPKSDFLKVRAAHLSAYAVPIEKVESELREQHAAIENFQP